MPASDLLLKVLPSPSIVSSFTAQQWDLLISQARRTNLMARLALLFKNAGLLNDVPVAPRVHLESALLMSKRQDRAMRWELDCIREALHRVPQPIILLKGAAYLAADLHNAAGRMFGDVDILVPKENLARTEAELKIHGWKDTVTDQYDQKYYRSWMHELPPLQHILRNTVMDVHHSILPETARVRVNIRCMIDAARPLGDSGLYVLAPADMVLHSAAHLFHEGEFNNALRDLCDLDSLLSELSRTEPDFWNQLILRAELTGLKRPIYYAIRYTKHFLDTEIPDEVLRKVEKFSPWFPKAMDALYHRAFRPFESTQDSGVNVARFVLYLRSHWLRMPIHLLTYHLIRKFFVRSFTE